MLHLTVQPLSRRRMDYRIARNGQVIGSYSLLQLQRQLASGQVVATDLAQADGMEEWLSVADLFPEAAPADEADLQDSAVATRLYPDPPDLKWWIALLLGIVTLGAFFVVWDVVEAAWLRRVERSNTALILYCIALVLFVVNVPSQIGSISHALFGGPPVDAPFAWLFGWGAFLVRLVARFVLRSDLLRHFNQAEPYGLKLHWLMTLIFGGLYFQYHFNQINERKRALKVSVRA